MEIKYHIIEFTDGFQTMYHGEFQDIEAVNSYTNIMTEEYIHKNLMIIKGVVIKTKLKVEDIELKVEE